MELNAYLFKPTSVHAKLDQWKMTFSNVFFLRPIHINARTEKPEHSRKKKGKRNEDGGRGVDRAYQGQAQSHKLPHTRDEG